MDRHHEQHILVLPEGYYASPKRIIKALEAMKHHKGMNKGFSLAMSEVDHKATLWVRPIASDHQSIVKVVPGIRHAEFSTQKL